MAKTKKTHVNLVGSSTAVAGGRKRKRLAKAKSRRGAGSAGRVGSRTRARGSR